MENSLKSFNLLPLDEVKIRDRYWEPYRRLVKEVVIPYQWEVLNDRVPEAEPSHAIKNLRIAAGLEEGEFHGFFFQDTDLAKWLEAVAYSLQTDPDAALEKIADEAIELVEMAQQPDGYLNSYFTVKGKGKRWTNLEECHELYTAGHFIEAAVAYYKATGKRKLLDVMCRFADYIDSVFGSESGKLRGYDGHQEIELALVRLYRVTGDKRYLKLSKFFLDERGTEPYYFEAEWEKRGRVTYWENNISKNPSENREYAQTHLPVRKQKEAVGHAVRLVYMLTGMADVAKEYVDIEMLQACRALWENIVTKQMYITGGIGSSVTGEAFTFNYDLPNDTVYAETCASIGLIVFAQRMLMMENKGCYSDVIEKALYNVIMSSMGKDGKHYFYVNPMEVWPEASEKNPGRFHVKSLRQKWFGCACCPPNLARLVTSLGQYIYSTGDNALYIHQYIASEADIHLNGDEIRISQESNYPWEGNIRIDLSMKEKKKFTISVRIPGWCRKSSVKVNGENVSVEDYLKDGYVYITREWSDTDYLELNLDMPVEIMEANPLVRADAGKVAIQRGPVVYCIEEADNADNLADISLSADPDLQVEYEPDLLGGIMAIYGDGYRRINDGWQNELYKVAAKEIRTVRVKAVPYCLWGNRSPGEMTVWIRQNLC